MRKNYFRAEQTTYDSVSISKVKDPKTETMSFFSKTLLLRLIIRDLVPFMSLHFPIEVDTESAVEETVLLTVMILSLSLALSLVLTMAPHIAKSTGEEGGTTLYYTGCLIQSATTSSFLALDWHKNKNGGFSLNETCCEFPLKCYRVKRMFVFLYSHKLV